MPMLLGAHMSIAGGFDQAVQRAHAAGCQCVQIFLKNNNQWRAVEIGDGQAAKFRSSLDEFRISHPLAHASYLINLASPDQTLWRKSVEGLAVEVRRAEQLAIPHLVVHPGAYTSATEERGLENVVRALDEIHAQTSGMACTVLLETTAGQGTCLGWRFEQLAAILDQVRRPQRLGVCFDTCHVFAAGYALQSTKKYEATLAEFDRVVGIPRIRAIHLNDSRGGLGCRVDRHAHIGEGCLGLGAFRLLLNDPRLHSIPMYLETPKGCRDGEDWDVINLRVLRSLLRQRGKTR